MKTIKKFEEHIIKKSGDLGKNWSAEYHVNISKGKKPYIKKEGLLVEVDSEKTIPKNAIYLKPDKVKEYNEISKQIVDLEKQRDKILKNN